MFSTRYRTALPAGASGSPQPSVTVSGKRGSSQTVGEGLHGPPALRPSRLRRPLRPNSVPAHTPLRQRPRLVEGRVGRAFTALPLHGPPAFGGRYDGTPFPPTLPSGRGPAWWKAGWCPVASARSSPGSSPRCLTTMVSVAIIPSVLTDCVVSRTLHIGFT